MCLPLSLISLLPSATFLGKWGNFQITYYRCITRVLFIVLRIVDHLIREDMPTTFATHSSCKRVYGPCRRDWCFQTITQTWSRSFIERLCLSHDHCHFQNPLTNMLRSMNTQAKVVWLSGWILPVNEVDPLEHFTTACIWRYGNGMQTTNLT